MDGKAQRFHHQIEPGHCPFQAKESHQQSERSRKYCSAHLLELSNSGDTAGEGFGLEWLKRGDRAFKL
jgi:hypothetical protein